MLNSTAGAVWDITTIDNDMESVRSSKERPAVAIGIVELDKNDEIKQSYANSHV